MRILIDSTIPDKDYFTLSSVQPVFKYYMSGQQSIVVTDFTTLDFKQVRSTVVINTRNLVVIHVRFEQRYDKGQGWFFYLNAERVGWDDLTARQQQKVLDAYAKAPEGTATPGVLRYSPNKHRTAYKAVYLNERGNLYSYYNNTPYDLGKTLSELAEPEHGGGYYSFPTVEQAVEFGKDELVASDAVVAIIECEVWGKCVHYDSGKQATTYLKPLRIIESWPVRNVIPF